MTEDEVAAVLEAYAPMDENGPDKAKISISDMVGDVVFVCPIQQAARVTYTNSHSDLNYRNSVYFYQLTCLLVAIWFQSFDEHGMKVYQYYLTHRASNSPHPEWHGVRHFDDVQVCLNLND